MTYDYAIAGGGIVGLSVGLALTRRFPDARIVLLEKEPRLGQHQTGRNSGVIHSGIYYKPGSLKARYAIEGSRLIPEFCQQHGIRYDVCGKLIVATHEGELPRLQKLYERGLGHGLAVRELGPEQIREIEPHCAGIKAVQVPSTGIADYGAVARTYAKEMQAAGAEIQLHCALRGIVTRGTVTTLETTGGDIATRFLINCTGVHCDRVAKMDKVNPGARIVPFRGEYFQLKEGKRYLVKHLIYPVPDPAFPFLGVHFTRMTDGTIHCGPNAVLALAREGYHKTDFNLRDLADVLSYRGFWRLAMRHAGAGMKEVWRSLSKSAFTRSLQRLIPEVTRDDLEPCHAGIRAQALLSDGTLVDDFLIVRGTRSIHVCNAPSPAATASLPIGREIAEQVPAPQRTTVAAAV